MENNICNSMILTSRRRLFSLVGQSKHKVGVCGVNNQDSAVLAEESRFNLWNHGGRTRVRRYAGERTLQSAFIERHNSLSPKIMVWGEISYHGRYNLQRIEGIPGASFECDKAHPHIEKTVRVFCSAQHMQLLPWPAYSPDMWPFEQVWYLIGRRLARDPRPAASKHELLRHKQAIRNSLPQTGIQYLFDSMPRPIAALIAVRV
ncbi:transposable element Tcb2 transposase [Trichonephila clavipes]|nr:transposable element Tcb2 transposase [Trichonephila clavipes]